MKKLLLLALTAVMIVSCYDQNDVAKSVKKDDFGICIYDSCEYLIGVHGYKGFFAHKGNCRFCKKRRKQEIRELIKELKEK